MHVISVEIDRTRRDQLPNPELFKWTGALRGKGRHWVPEETTMLQHRAAGPLSTDCASWVWTSQVRLPARGRLCLLRAWRRLCVSESLRKNVSHLSSILLSFLEGLGLLVWAQGSEKGKKVNWMASSFIFMWIKWSFPPGNIHKPDEMIWVRFPGKTNVLDRFCVPHYLFKTETNFVLGLEVYGSFSCEAV